MKTKEINEKLIKLGCYKKTIDKVLIDEKSDLYYFVKFNNENIHFGYIEFNTITIDEHNKFTSLKEFVLSKDKRFFEKYSEEILSNMIIDFYIIPKNKETKNDLKKFEKIYQSNFSSNPNISIFQLFKHFQKYNYTYSILFTLYILLNITLYYLALTSIGIPLNIVPDVTILTQISLFFALGGILSFLGLLPILLIIYLPDIININLIEIIIAIFLIIMFLIHLKNKSSEDIRYHRFNNSVFKSLKDIYIFWIQVSICIFIIVSLIYPSLFIFESFKQHNNHKKEYNPTLLFNISYDFYGYPKKLTHTKSKEEFILVGYDETHYYTYKLKSSVYYIKNMEDILKDIRNNNTEKFELKTLKSLYNQEIQYCRNISNNGHNSEIKLIYEILSESAHQSIPNIQLLKIVDTKDIVIDRLRFDDFHIDKVDMYKTCDKLLKTEIKELNDILKEARLKNKRVEPKVELNKNKKN